ncbi:hypothetical protein CDEF62S_02386 [Castellaniella defragrans]
MKNTIYVRQNFEDSPLPVVMERAYIIHTKDNMMTKSQLFDVVRSIRGFKHYPYIIEFFTDNKNHTTVINHETKKFYN